jgi:hypothetical protein
MIERRSWHKKTFIAAGLYNIGWGLYASVDPQYMFRFASMPPMAHPQIFACLGMVVGLYGLLYLEVARVPERGFLLAAIGLLGKVLGPVGLLVLIAQGTWPPETLILCLTNDFIWWVPFGLYLKDSWPEARAEWARWRADERAAGS